MKDFHFEISEEIEDKFKKYAHFIIETSKRFNITGFRSFDDVFEKLILESIEPVVNIKVPRGTRFVDLGSGAGVPGIPIGIIFDKMRGLLIESNSKKAVFIKNVIDEFDLNNLEVICRRAENVIRDSEYRESFDWVFARAFQNIYSTIELGAPFLRISGLLYIYSCSGYGDLSEGVVSHADVLGLTFLKSDEHAIYNVAETGLLLRKLKQTPEVFPRRYAVIGREARRAKGIV